jgi:hypothetical protein
MGTQPAIWWFEYEISRHAGPRMKRMNTIPACGFQWPETGSYKRSTIVEPLQ